MARQGQQMLRAAGAERALAAAGLGLAGGQAQYGQWTEEWGRRGVDLLVRDGPGLDAIFCGNDQIARGAADQLRETGLRVPQDVALVGFDNRGAVATACRPPLTTVDMNLRQLAEPRRAPARRVGRPFRLRPAVAAVQPGSPRIDPPRDSGTLYDPGR